MCWARFFVCALPVPAVFWPGVARAKTYPSHFVELSNRRFPAAPPYVVARPPHRSAPAVGPPAVAATMTRSVKPAGALVTLPSSP